jgi:endonuclease/exonuclease/phosphatase family metal-dependent hydrolase
MLAKLFTLFYLLLLVSGDTECPIVTSGGQDRRTNKHSLRLVQYNVEWLFVDHYSGFDCPGSQCTWKNETDAKTHLGFVSNIVSILEPDIVNFCEVEGCDELNMVVNSLNNTPDYNYYLKKGTDTGTGQNVGLITKIDPLVNLYRDETKIAYPIPGSMCGYNGSGTTGVSKHYITEYMFENYASPVALISAHLIAIPTDPARCSQREAQAQILQNIVLSYIQKGYEVILLGDMNDYDGEVLDINQDKPLSQVLDILKGYKGVNRESYVLTSVATKIPQIERFSDWWDSDDNCDTYSVRDYSMIDHILVTSGIYEHIVNAYIYHGYSEFCGKYNSDHYPVVVDLEF